MINLDFLFKYATISHGLLATAYISKIDDKHREKFLYLLAHIFITIAMLLRINEDSRGNIIPALFGTVGAGILLLFFLLTTFIFHKKYRVSFSGDLYMLNILCILGQIGMILIYWVEYFKHKNEKMKNKIFFSRVQIIIFAALSLFYLIMAFKADNNYSLIFVGLLMISLLYLFFLYNSLIENKKLHERKT